MHNDGSATTWRRWALVAASASAALALSACGGGDDGAAAEQPTASAQTPADATPSAGAAAASGLRSCLEDSGFTVQEGSTPAEVAESLGIQEQLRLVGPDEGMGSVTVYETMPAAEEALASERSSDAPGVTIARVDTTVYTYAGEYDSEAALSGCLQ